jgi:3-methyladenine DNA glycosylase AlkD
MSGILKDVVKAALASLEEMSTQKDRDNLARFGINAKNALGVSMANVQLLAKRMGTSHELAAALWETGVYEARMVASFVDDPALVTPAQMDRWCRDFDNWGIVDTVCFKLFDRVPHAWSKLEPWSKKRDEFQKRAAFALLACLALHDKKTGDEQFLRGLTLVDAAAGDDRNFVKKGVSWALRSVGLRNPGLRAAATELATRLSKSGAPSARWLGKEALREFAKKGKTKKEKKTK